MPVAPVVTMHAEHGWDNSILLHQVQLVLAYGLTVDHNITTIFPRPELLSSIFHRSDHQVARRVTVAVCNELPTLLVAKGNFSIDVLV